MGKFNLRLFYVVRATPRNIQAIGLVSRSILVYPAFFGLHYIIITDLSFLSYKLLFGNVCQGFQLFNMENRNVLFTTREL